MSREDMSVGRTLPGGRTAGPGLWTRATGVFVPPRAVGDFERERRIRTAVGVAYMVVPISAGFAVFTHTHVPGPLGDVLTAIHLGSIVLLLLCLLVLRTTGWLALAVTPPLAWFAALFVASAYLTGGPSSPGAYPMLAVPLFALITMGRAHCLGWLGAAFAIYVGMLALDGAGLLAPYVPTDAERNLFWIICTTTTLVLAVTVVGNFEHARAQALGRLEHANRALEAARADADAANQKQTLFLTNMSHEIRTPLTAVLGFADVAHEQAAHEVADEADLRALGTIERNARNLLKILDDMLDLSKIETGQIEIRPARHRVDDVLEQAASLLRSQARAKGAELVVERVPGTPAELETDALRLNQILVNLLGNAIKFTFQGEVRLVARPLAHAGEQWIRIEVADSGIGMTQPQMDAIFEPFSQADASTARLYGGTGLGLSISRVLVERLGGEIGVASERGVGTTFRVDLPLASPRQAASVEPTASAAASPGVRTLRGRVLVVDDLLDNRRLISHFLKRAGASVTLAESGEEALRQHRVAEISGNRYDLIITDIQMPRMDGYAVLAALRAQGCRAPIVALTAHAMATERERCLAAGFADFASKPIDRATLLEFAARNLERSGSTAPAQPLAAASAAPTRTFSRLQRMVEALVQALVPPKRRGEPLAVESTRTLLLLALAPVAILPVEAWLVHRVVAPDLAGELAALVLLTAPLCIGVLLLYRWSGSLTLAVSGLRVYGCGLVTLLTWYNGGAGSIVAVWHLMLPMAAMATVGIAPALCWALVGLSVNVGFWLAASLGVSLRNAILPEMVPFAATVSNVGLAAIVTAMGLVHERAKTEAVDTLASANRWLEDARRDAERAGRAKSHFLANVSHELRTPLTAILGFAELVAERWRARADSPLLESLRTIRRSGRQLLDVINDLLDLAKIEAGSLGIESIELELGPLLADALAPLRAGASEKGLALEVALDTPLPERALGDPTRIRQVLANLASNALKFTERGRIAVTAGVVGGAERRLRIAVSDTGCGIPAEHLPNLFTPFHQVDASATREHGGRGLGLALCRRLAELMGGAMQVTSEPGVGSTFTLELPLRELPGTRTIAALPEPGRAATGAGALRARVLLAEDGADNRRLIGHVLREAGAEVETADDGQRAVELGVAALERGQAYDVILMDLEMPVLDGVGATRALREAGYTAPIVALTAHSLTDERERCLAAGFTDLASKPINRSVLLGQIAALCEKPHRTE
jgi:signal transduction histidine kinase/DNA-binding response OmpR family regulator